MPMHGTFYLIVKGGTKPDPSTTRTVKNQSRHQRAPLLVEIVTAKLYITNVTKGIS
ncbi:hypothetical protein HOLleu_28690 [Holothuria leucospilota]|uniref:Uncharacterized protein n=1 Tax=Holothuria leucospilota TaxID=206669 RepID=A0A9Q1H0P1_HOLLE|nr:hypothetical protein HOLleu_28690 [Holothuria leucospilota]